MANMNKYIVPLLLYCGLLTWSGCEESYPSAPKKTAEIADQTAANYPVKKANLMGIYVHFMPWFETNTSNGTQWGYHWTMKNCNPDVVDATGKRQIASHYYPLTGPYASGDAAILDYQCLLMKYAGVDGVMVDWYGVNSDNAVAKHKSNTEALAKAIARAGLKLAIVYEDRALDGTKDYMEQLREDLRYLSKMFFHRDYYVKIDGKPLLMIFGPVQVKRGKDWYRAFAILKDKPVFLCLNGHAQYANNGGYTNSEGEYTWVNPVPDYSVAQHFKYYIGGAMPGFHDYYQEGGAGTGYTTYDAENGALFNRQLNAAKSAGLKWLQVSTWNDYGEGTTIEPTREYGYKYLVALQKFAGVAYQEADLAQIYRWYELRRSKPNDPRVQAAYQALARLEVDKAREILK